CDSEPPPSRWWTSLWTRALVTSRISITLSARRLEPRQRNIGRQVIHHRRYYGNSKDISLFICYIFSYQDYQLSKKCGSSKLVYLYEAVNPMASANDFYRKYYWGSHFER